MRPCEPDREINRQLDQIEEYLSPIDVPIKVETLYKDPKLSDISEKLKEIALNPNASLPQINRSNRIATLAFEDKTAEKIFAKV